MKHEYHEGDEALARFNETVTKLFRVPKSSVKQPPKPERKSQEPSKD
jgi:hypothetical protein